MPLEEEVNQASTEMIIKEKTELGEVFENMDSDVEDIKTGMSTVDFNSRLTGTEISACIRIDELKRMGILPDIKISNVKKRLSVSFLGQGRQEKVSLFQGVDNRRNGESMMSKLFSRRE